MVLTKRLEKPKNNRTKRALVNRAPKIYENPKQTLFLRGHKTHKELMDFMKEISQFKKPHCVVLTKKKNEIKPFEDASDIEKTLTKIDASLFMFGSHNKKRPNNLVIGRTFDHHVLDMYELGIDSYKSMSEVSSDAAAPSLGIKPALVFIGEEFETLHDLKRLKNMLIDLFHTQESDVVSLKYMEYVMAFTYVEKKLLLRTYRIQLKNIGETSPRVDLINLGPSVDFSLRRNAIASDDLFKKACRKPNTQGKKIKNVKRDAFNNKKGTVHVKQQSYNTLQTRKMKGLKKKKNNAKNNSDD